MFLILHNTHVSHFIEKELLKLLEEKAKTSISWSHVLVFYCCYNKLPKFSGLKTNLLLYISLGQNSEICPTRLKPPSQQLAFFYVHWKWYFLAHLGLGENLVLTIIVTETLIFLLTVHWGLIPASRDHHVPWPPSSIFTTSNDKSNPSTVHLLDHSSITVFLWWQQEMVLCFPGFMCLVWACWDDLGFLSN